VLASLNTIGEILEAHTVTRTILESLVAVLLCSNTFAVDWPSYGSNNFSSKYSPLTQIAAENFSSLKTAWTWESPDQAIADQYPNTSMMRRIGFKATPLVIDGTMYLSTGLGQIAALDALTGKTKWINDRKSYERGGAASILGPITRGVSYWSDGDDRRILSGTHDGYLIALNADTGELIDSFGESGLVDLMTSVPRVSRDDTLILPGGEKFHISVDSPPTISNGVVVVGCSMSDRPPNKEWPPGYVQAFDVRTGEQKWVFETVPRSEEFAVKTWENESWKYMGNTNVWSMMSADDELGYVYLPVSTPTSDYYGGDRLGDNLFAESLVCVDVETGKRIWHFQMVHHGLWDWDLPAAPNLLDIVVDGKPIKAVAQVSKQGWVYVFDRVTGEPVWPIEELPVAPSDVPGERTSPTQPHPTWPLPFEVQGISIDNLIDFTPGLRAKAIKEVSHYRIGPMFTPPSLYEEGGTRGTIQLPGAGGGANWSGAAVDPESGILYVPSRTAYSMVVLAELDPNIGTLKYVRSGTLGPGSTHPARPQRPRGPDGLPLLKPPYSRMTAIDINTGEHLWMTPTGMGRREIRNHPALKGLDLPGLGGQGTSGPLLTKSLLIHGLFLDGGKGALAAYDKRTGEVVGQVDLPGTPVGTPMTYEIDGTQYLALTVRVGRNAGTLISLKWAG
jgi:quinoprotein glucose dehydrogenase